MKCANQIWVVDDDEDEHFLIQAVLQKVAPAVKVTSFYDGENAVSYLRTTAALPGLVLLDLNMNGINGFETLVEIRTLVRYEELPVVILTNSGASEDKSRAQVLGANGFCAKTGNIDKFEILVSQLIDQWGVTSGQTRDQP